MKEKKDLAKLVKDRINIIDIIGKEEKLINPFLRCDDEDLKIIMRKKFNTDLSELNIFSALREWKDNF